MRFISVVIMSGWAEEVEFHCTGIHSINVTMNYSHSVQECF